MEETEQEQQTTEDKKKLKIPINQSNQFSELWYTVKSELWEVNSEFRFFSQKLRDFKLRIARNKLRIQIFFPQNCDINSELRDINSELRDINSELRDINSELQEKLRIQIFFLRIATLI